MGAAEKLMWDEIVSLAPLGVLGDSDRLVVECIAELMVMKRTFVMAEFDPRLLGRLDAMLGKIGFTPSARSKIKVAPKSPNANPFDNL